ncbi:MAG: sigma-70 family RNA polymerase sigma factor [Myxococcota bacterium]
MLPQTTKAEPANLVKRASIQLADAGGEWVSSGKGEDNLYASFVRKATEIPRLSEEEERVLGLKVRDHGDQSAAKKLVYHNMRLAIKMAHQYRRSWTLMMDLVQEALTGMGIASKRWDPDENTRFGTYAAYWIKAQLSKFLMTNSRLIHTGNSRAGRKVYFALPQIRRALLAKGQNPTPELIAKELGEDPEEVALILSRLDSKESSLSAPINSDLDNTLGDTLASDWDSPETTSARTQIQNTIEKMINSFEKNLDSERDKVIWKEHLVAGEPVNLVELGRRYGVSKQRMGQLADRLKKSFRRHVIDTLGPHTQLSWLFSEDEGG